MCEDSTKIQFIIATRIAAWFSAFAVSPGFWYPYKNIFSLVNELGLQPFTQWTKSAQFSPAGLEVIVSPLLTILSTQDICISLKKFIHFCSCVWTNECEAVGYSSIAAGAKKKYSKMCGAKYWGRVAEEGVRGLEGPIFGAWAQVLDPRIQECPRQLPFSNEKTRRSQILPFVPTVDTHLLPINVPLPHMALQISKRKSRGFYASGQSYVMKHFRPALMAWPWDA